MVSFCVLDNINLNFKTRSLVTFVLSSLDYVTKISKQTSSKINVTAFSEESSNVDVCGTLGWQMVHVRPPRDHFHI